MLAHAIILSLFLSGCSNLIEQLAKDPASACGYSTISYGGGAILPSPTIPIVGVYVHQRFCRSATPGSEVTITPDGVISVKHGQLSIQEEGDCNEDWRKRGSCEE